MRNSTRYLLTVSAATVFAFAGTLAVYADWSVPGTTTVETHAAAMPRGEKPEVTKQPGAVVVTWGRQEIAPGAPMGRYVVTARRAGAGRPDITRTVKTTGGPTESVTFAAAELAGGTWQWTIAPGLHGWTGDEGPKSEALTFAGAPAARQVSPSAAAPTTVEPVAPSPATTSTPAPTRPGASGGAARPSTPAGNGKEPEPRTTTTTPAAPVEATAPEPIESESNAVEPPPAAK